MSPPYEPAGALSTGKRRAVPYVRLLGAQAAVGAAAIFARFALTGTGPLAVSALRLSIAAAVFVPLALPLRRISLRREALLAVAGTALAVHFATWIASLQYTSVAISTLLVTTTPIWTESYDIAAGRRTPNARFALSLVLAIAGVALIAGSRSAQPAPIPGHALAGDALAIAGSVTMAIYLLIVRDTGARHADVLPTTQIVARTYAWAAIVLLAASAAAQQGPPALEHRASWAGILAMALVSQGLGHTGLNAALRDFSPSTIAMTTLLEPVIAGLLAAMLFAESLTVAAIAGAALVLAAIAIVLRDTTRERIGDGAGGR